MEKMRIGLVGCGMISDIYMKNLTERYSDRIEVLLCADLNEQSAQNTAQKYNLRAVTVNDLLTSSEIDCVLNLTIPAAHYEINRKALLNGKHAYSEKPMALTVEEGEELLKIAEDNKLYVASAPDTFLGDGIQTAKRLIEEGHIGTPVTVSANILARGPEGFHPRPEFFYQEGAGPLMDMGPYYLTTLVVLFGSVKAVCAQSTRSFPVRRCMNATRKGDTFETQIDTNISAVLRFENGMLATLRACWDLGHTYWESPAPMMEVMGTKGTLYVPDPNCFCANYNDPPFAASNCSIRMKLDGEDLCAIPLDKKEFVENCRGIGLWQAVGAMENHEKPLVNEQLSMHVLEIMAGILESCKTNEFVMMKHPLSAK